MNSTTRGLFAGGQNVPSPSNYYNLIEFITTATTGNATDFGDLTADNQRSGGMSNSIRGIFAGGSAPASQNFVNSIDKITIQTLGDATDFGDYHAYTGSGLSAASQGAGCSDSHGGLS